jgi:plasmid stabilization system protein ParE
VTPRLVLRPQAEAELLDARDWYEDQRPGLGGAFAAEVDRALAGILQAPLAGPRVQGEIRRVLVRRFPYAIYFPRCPMRSSCLPSSMVDGTLDAGSRDADVELRSRADRGSHPLAFGCSPQRYAYMRQDGGLEWAWHGVR